MRKGEQTRQQIIRKAAPIFNQKGFDGAALCCPLLNTAIDSDDGNPQLRARARPALSSLLDRLQSIADEGQRGGEVRGEVDAAKLGPFDCKYA